MPAKRLTDAFIRTRNAPKRERGDPPQVAYIDTLERGLALVLVVSYGGTKTFRVLTYVNGKPVSYKLGTYGQQPGQLSLKEAKDKAWAYFEDPQKFKTKAETGSFKEVAEDWFKRHVEKKGLLSAREIRRQLDVYVYPKLAGTKFLDIRRSNVAALLDYIEDHHSAAMADAVLATLRSIMVWYQSRHEDYVSPIVKGMRRAEPKKRARILNDNELRSIWRAAGECGTFGALLKFALLTAQRREKVTTMRWDDVVDGEWTIRSSEREKGTGGILKLPQLALDVLEDQQARRLAGNGFVFPGSLRGRRGVQKPGLPTFNSFSKAKHDLDAKLGDLPHWTIHDLRRTAKSLMSRAGIRPDISERVLGHAITGVEGVYDHHSYGPEKADALQKLAALVASIVNPPSGANVVKLRR
jgi:integrase